MHGLINRAIQNFVRDTYGTDTWLALAQAAGVEPPRFETMLSYDDALTDAILDACCAGLAKPKEDILEDIGTYLVSHPNVEALRRLLRFGGVTFVEFLHSLDDLPDRARLAVPDLNLPLLELHEPAEHHYELLCRAHFVGFGHVLLGMLRTMADDYGALVFLNIKTLSKGVDQISVALVESAFSQGRAFDLGAGGG